MKQEWRVKEKTSTPALTASDDDMDLLNDDKSQLIKDGSPPPTSTDINMVFMLPVELSHLVLRPTRMFIVCMFRNQVYTHTIQKWIQNNQCHNIYNIYYRIMSLQKTKSNTLRSIAAERHHNTTSN
jgi:hypothetical protein